MSNNIASDISNLSKRYHGSRSGSWYLDNFEISRASIIAKYHVQVILLFVYDRSQEIFGNAQEIFISLRMKNTNTGICIRNNLFTSMKKKRLTVFCENQFKPWKANKMKKFSESILKSALFANFGKNSRETVFQFFSFVLDNVIV